MTVTGVSGVAVSFRTVTPEPSAHAPARKSPAPSATDSVELSQQAAAEARTTDPAARAETRLKSFDKDGDGVVTKTEFTTGAFELLQPASVRFFHQPAKPEGSADLAIREYTIASQVKPITTV
jgi:hypothetical protein